MSLLLFPKLFFVERVRSATAAIHQRFPTARWPAGRECRAASISAKHLNLRWNGSDSSPLRLDVVGPLSVPVCPGHFVFGSSGRLVGWLMVATLIFAFARGVATSQRVVVKKFLVVIGLILITINKKECDRSRVRSVRRSSKMLPEERPNHRLRKFRPSAGDLLLG